MRTHGDAPRKNLCTAVAPAVMSRADDSDHIVIRGAVTAEKAMAEIGRQLSLGQSHVSTPFAAFYMRIFCTLTLQLPMVERSGGSPTSFKRRNKPSGMRSRDERSPDERS